MVRANTDHGQASGFIIGTTDTGGAYIMTNYHVVEGAKTVEVQVHDTETCPATVLGYHGQKDLALLEICCGSFQALSLQETDAVTVGEEVIAIGYPLGIAGPPSVTSGIISAYRYNDERQS